MVVDQVEGVAVGVGASPKVVREPKVDVADLVEALEFGLGERDVDRPEAVGELLAPARR